MNTVRKSKLSPYKIRKIMKMFCVDVDATQASVLLGMNRNTINRWYGIFRTAISSYQEELRTDLWVTDTQNNKYLYANACRIYNNDGNRVPGCAMDSKLLVCEIDGVLITETIDYEIAKQQTQHDSNWDNWTEVQETPLLFRRDEGTNHFFSIKSTENPSEYKQKEKQVDAFWGFCKRRLMKFNGVKNTYELHIKECEWRWKKNHEELQVDLWSIIN